MKSSKKWSYCVFCLLVIASMLLAGCGGAAATQSETEPTQAASGEESAAATQPAEEPSTSDSGSLNYAVYAVNSEPLTNWDPSVEFSNGIWLMNNMYEQLVRYNNETEQVEPLLATGYTVSDDGLTWTFTLRQGVKFHDGTDFNAEAVKFSIDRTIRLNQGAAYIWAPVQEVKVVDDYTVEFDLSYAAPLDLIAATGYAAFIYSPTSVGDNDDWFQDGKECGTGPYMLKSFTWGDEVIIEKFADYWGGWNDNQISTVVIKKVAETATRRQMIETGEATITNELTYTDIDALKQNPDVVVTVTPSLQNLLLMLNTQKEPLNDVKVRQALSYAFPYQDVIDYAMGGYATQSHGAVPSGIWGHSDEITQYTYDLEKAKELLTEAGYPDGGFSLVLTYMAGDEAEKNTAELYQAELGKLGITVDIRSMPWDSQWEMAKSTNPDDRQDIFIMYWWPDLPSPYSFLYSLYHSEDEPSFNLGYYYNADFDTLIDDANTMSATDKDAASQMFIQAQQTLIDDAVTIQAYDKQVVWITTPNFKGFEFNPIYPTVVFFYNTYFE